MGRHLHLGGGVGPGRLGDADRGGDGHRSGSGWARCSPRWPASGRGISPAGSRRWTTSPAAGCSWPSGWARCTTGWLAFEADEGRKVRAEKLDEGLAIYDGLMHGQPFSFSGKHYQVRPTDFLTPPPPVQQPRVPVWVVGAYPSAQSLRRAAKWDGLLSTKVGFGADDPFRPRRSRRCGGRGPAAAGGGRSAVGGVRRGRRGCQRPGDRGRAGPGVGRRRRDLVGRVRLVDGRRRRRPAPGPDRRRAARRRSSTAGETCRSVGASGVSDRA